ncbi:MAG: selenocysteine-specific translation elongation factor [Sciscionella sp.]
MHVIATAGHVDHGKSMLVRALTGMEPDRWEAEQRRGMTIDLGFAWMTLPSGERLAFVDVPGHERFVSNMLAGAGPAPAVMFVVAADEGWMPQSEEHLAALDALGVRHGLLAVTRRDLAEPGPVTERVLDRIAETSLGAIPSVAVSGVTGTGLDELRAGLATLVAGLPEPDTGSDVRLWVDRSFSVRGAGTVVTGTLRGGTVSVGEELVLASTGRRLRVRGLQSLGEQMSSVPAVARVAVNLRGVEADAVVRGDALLTPDLWRSTDHLDVALRGHDGDELAGELILHVGSAAVTARPRRLGPGVLRLRLDRALPLRFGDQALLRDPGQHLVVAGVEVLDIDPPRLRRRGAARQRAADLAGLLGPTGADRALASELMLRRREFMDAAELRALGLACAGAEVGGWHADTARWAELKTELPALVRAWRTEHPLQPGVPVDVVRQRLRLPTAVVGELVRRARLSIVDGQVREADAAAELPAQVEAALATLERDLAETPFLAPEAGRLAELRLDARAIAAAVRAGRLLKIADGVVLLPGADQRAARVLSTLEPPFTLSQARRALETTRRVAVPLLEHLDRKGFTERLPDSTRRMR